MHWEDDFENLSLKDQKAMGIGIFTGSLIGVRYVTHVEVDGGALVYDEIEDFSGNYEYIDVDMQLNNRDIIDIGTFILWINYGEYDIDV